MRNNFVSTHIYQRPSLLEYLPAYHIMIDRDRLRAVVWETVYTDYYLLTVEDHQNGNEIVPFTLSRAKPEFKYTTGGNLVFRVWLDDNNELQHEHTRFIPQRPPHEEMFVDENFHDGHLIEEDEGYADPPVTSSGEKEPASLPWQEIRASNERMTADELLAEINELLNEE